jgi:hypothetical protein
VEWYLASKGRVTGPLTLEALVESALDGQVGPEDYVWRPGAEIWERADGVADLWAASDGLPRTFPWLRAIVAGMAVSGALLAAAVGSGIRDFALLAGPYTHEANQVRPIKRNCALDTYLAGKCR